MGKNFECKVDLVVRKHKSTRNGHSIISFPPDHKISSLLSFLFPSPPLFSILCTPPLRKIHLLKNVTVTVLPII